VLLENTRPLFPVTQSCVYLNGAAESPLNLKSRRRLDEYLDIMASRPQDKPPVREQVRDLLARLLGGSPSEYALVTSTGVGVGLVALGLKWNPGDNVVLPASEHWNNIFPWLALREKGVEVRFAPVDVNNRVKPEDIGALVDGRTRIVAVAAVRFNSGFRTDLKRLSEIAHKTGALLLVDGIQAAGVVPLNVDNDGIDILCCAGFKWLLGLPGTGFMYVRQGVQDIITPAMPGMFAAEDSFTELNYLDDARRFETGSIAYSLFYAWTAGLEMLLDLGIENIYGRILELTDHLIQGLSAKGVQIISPVDRPEERSSIVIISVGDAVANKALYKRLRSNNIIVTLRAGVLRISPSFFNTKDEIDTLLSFL